MSDEMRSSVLPDFIPESDPLHEELQAWRQESNIFVDFVPEDAEIVEVGGNEPEMFKSKRGK